MKYVIDFSECGGQVFIARTEQEATIFAIKQYVSEMIPMIKDSALGTLPYDRDAILHVFQHSVDLIQEELDSILSEGYVDGCISIFEAEEVDI